MFAYQKLDIYQNSKEVVKKTYEITRKLPSSEQYGLISQMNRAAVSIPSNIAEGSGRIGVKEKLQFLNIARASLMELTCQAEISYELNLIDENTHSQFAKMCNNLSVKINNYQNYIKKL